MAAKVPTECQLLEVFYPGPICGAHVGCFYMISISAYLEYDTYYRIRSRVYPSAYELFRVIMDTA